MLGGRLILKTFIKLNFESLFLVFYKYNCVSVIGINRNGDASMLVSLFTKSMPIVLTDS